MTTALIVLALVIAVGSFVGGFFVGRKSSAAVAPIADAVSSLDTAKDAEAAARAAGDNAEKKAQEVLHASDDVVRANVARLRARGRSGDKP